MNDRVTVMKNFGAGPPVMLLVRSIERVRKGEKNGTSVSWATWKQLRTRPRGYVLTFWPDRIGEGHWAYGENVIERGEFAQRQGSR